LKKGWHVPTDDLTSSLALHEAMHPVEGAALRTEPVVEEINARMTEAAGIPFDVRVWGRAEQAIAYRHVSKYAAKSPHEFMAEALSEWNQFGDASGPAAKAVGTAVDRYMARGAPGAEEMGRIRSARYVAVVDTPTVELFPHHAGAEDGYPNYLGGSLVPYDLMVLRVNDIPAWASTHAEFVDARDSGRPLPSTNFRPLNLSGTVDVELDSVPVRTGTTRHPLAPKWDDVDFANANTSINHFPRLKSLLPRQLRFLTTPLPLAPVATLEPHSAIWRRSLRAKWATPLLKALDDPQPAIMIPALDRRVAKTSQWNVAEDMPPDDHIAPSLEERLEATDPSWRARTLRYDAQKQAGVTPPAPATENQLNAAPDTPAAPPAKGHRRDLPGLGL